LGNRIVDERRMSNEMMKEIICKMRGGKKKEKEKGKKKSLLLRWI